MQYKSPKHSLYLFLFSITIILIWIIFKQFYPYPFITLDSVMYIDSATKNLDIDYWPIGYSKFIHLVGQFSHSHTLLVTIQYITIQCSFLYLYFTLKSIFKLNRWSCYLILLFTLFNPLFIIASNHIMSDALFTAITIIWISQLLNIIVHPKHYMLYTQAILVLLCLNLRYTALYYPAITILALSMSSLKFKEKALGVILTLILLGVFIQYTRLKMEFISGVRSFSSSNGWKKANNALYMYSNLAPTDTSSVPVSFKLIHKIVKSYFKGPHQKVDLLHYQEEPSYGCFYMFSPQSPLIKYDSVKTGVLGDLHNLKTSPRCNVIFNSYANYLIKKYPLQYIKSVIIPNLIAYYSPILEIYGDHTPLYSEWTDYYGGVIRSIFKMKTISNPSKYLHIRGIILSPSALIFSMIHSLFLLSIIIICAFIKLIRINKNITYCLIVLIAVCIINFLFYINLSPSILRFQFNTIVIEFCIFIWLIDFLIKNQNTLNNN